MENDFPYFKWIALALVLAGIFLAWSMLPLADWVSAFGAYARSHGQWGPVLFLGVFVLATIVLAPCFFLTVGAGIAYGFWGIPLIAVSVLTGGTVAFFVARYILRDSVQRLLAKNTNAKAFELAIETDQWKTMLLLRLTPIIPYNLNNYFLASLNVSFKNYFWTLAAGNLPGTFVFVYLGTLGQNMEQGQKWQHVLLFLGVLAAYLLLRKVLNTRAELLRSNHVSSSR